MRRPHPFGLLLTFLTATAAAQPAPAEATPPAEAPAAAAPNATTPGGARPADDDADPKIPTVEDPMLRPVAPARRQLSSWRDAIRMVRDRSTELHVAAAQMRQAEAQSRQALAGTLPTLTGNANVQTHILRGTGAQFSSSGIQQGSIPNPPTTYGASLALRWPVFVPGVWHQLKSSRMLEESARLERKDAERIVLGGLASSIVAAVTAERLAEVSRVSLESSLSTLDLTRRRAQLGAASAFDVIRAEQEVSLAREQVVSADEGLRQAREALGLALGQTEPYMVTPGIDIDGLAGDARAVCRAEATVNERPDVRAARANVNVAERNVDAVDWEFWPTVSVVSDLNYRPVDPFTPNNKPVTWTVGAVLSWTLYDGGARYGQRDLTGAQLEAAREQLTATKRQAQIEIVQARRSIEVAESNLRVGRRSAELARQSARLSRVAFMNGTGTSFDLVDAARRLREAEINLAIREFDVVEAKIGALLALATCNV